MSTVSGVDADALLEGLNSAQRAAVTSAVSPLCILAGAGSGKTRVLTRRIAWRATTGDLDPRHVLALTFTRKAAGELTNRLRALGLRDRVAAGTFHSVAYAQLRNRWADRGIQPPALLDRKVGFVIRLLRNNDRGVQALDIVAEIEWAKARMIEPEGYAQAAIAAGRRPPLAPEEVAHLFAKYEAARRDQRLVDFDDLLRVCCRDLLRDPEFAQSQRWRFQHLFVDEFQDVNPLQQALLDAWRGDRLDLCVVGDPNQAIYAWNGADPTALTTFGSRFPSAEIVRLTENYRSTRQILATSNTLISCGGAGLEREGTLSATRGDGPVPQIRVFDNAKAEAHGVARSVRDHRRPGGTWSSQAILVRTNAQIPALEEALSAAKIPFRVRGAAPLLDQPEVKAAMGNLRRARGGFDDALADLATSVDEAADTGDRGDERRANVDALLQLARDFAAVETAPTVPAFLSWLFSTAKADQPDRYGDAVEITTFHAAKGLEWPMVHLAGLEQGLVPIGHAKTHGAMAEELRLFYVAVTRAELELSCTWASQRRFGTKDMTREMSPYLRTVQAACEALDAGSDPTSVPTEVLAGKRASAAPAKARHTRSRTRPDLPRAAGALAPADLDDDGRALLDALRGWRTDKARAAGMPAYVICNDRTLVEIASIRPASPDELLTVHGMGEVKVGRFGEELLALVGDVAGSE